MSYEHEGGGEDGDTEKGVGDCLGFSLLPVSRRAETRLT